jgi:hypothetical protein
VNSDQEIQDKKAAEIEHRLQQAYKEQGQAQTIGLCNESPRSGRPSLLERIRGQRARAEMESRKKDSFLELEYLLDKHPDVARILDLLDRVKE